MGDRSGSRGRLNGGLFIGIARLWLHVFGSASARQLRERKKLAIGNQIRFRGFAAPTGSFVNKLHEYIEHADECRRMARVALPQHRVQLEQMAVTWEQLAEVRRRQLAKRSREEGEPDEGKTPAGGTVRPR